MIKIFHHQFDKYSTDGKMTKQQFASLLAKLEGNSTLPPFSIYLINILDEDQRDLDDQPLPSLPGCGSRWLSCSRGGGEVPPA